MEWSRDQVLHMIKLYKEKRALWNQADPDFKNKTVKNYAWEDISTELKIGKAEIQAKMKSLSGQFQREARKINSGSGNYSYKTKWFAYAPLQFLEDKATLDTREAGTVNVTNEESIAGADSVSELDNIEIISSAARESAAVGIPAEEQLDTSGFHERRKRRHAEMASAYKKIAKSNMAEDTYSVMSTQIMDNPTAIKDEFLIFGEYVASVVRKLSSKYAQAVAKNEINNVLFKAEMGLYDTPPPPSSHGGPSHRSHPHPQGPVSTQ